MVQKNGYFQIEFRGNEAVCHVYPAKEGGRHVEYREITSFLESHGFSYSSKDITPAIFSETGGTVSVQASSTHEIAASMFVEIDEDHMKATCRFNAGSTKGNRLDTKDIMAGLAQKGVKYGIDQDAVLDAVNKPAYCQDVVLARGIEPVSGKDAWIEYFFNTNPDTKPSYNEDGTVDFHNLSNVISQVDKGTLLARLHPEDRGQSGKDVLGKDIAPHTVKVAYLQVGRNISLNEDRTEAYSDVTGHAKLYNDQIFVSDTYEVPADVDNSTGDIQYNGNVYVKGSVREGFSINAQGDVIVDGTVEGAVIVSGGDIVIKRGVNGMNRGTLQAQGNVISKFIENAKVYAKGYVETGSIIHSGVSAKENVVVNDKKGFITGSVVRSGGRVEAQTIGSEFGTATKIEIGIDPSVQERFANLDKEIKDMNAENQKIVPIIHNYKDQLADGIQLDPKNKEYYIKLKKTLMNNKQELEVKLKEFQEIKKQIENASDARVVVTRDIYPGVTIICSDVSRTMKEKRSFVSIQKKDGEIAIQNL